MQIIPHCLFVLLILKVVFILKQKAFFIDDKKVHPFFLFAHQRIWKNRSNWECIKAVSNVEWNYHFKWMAANEREMAPTTQWMDVLSANFHIEYANQIIISKNKIDLMVDSAFNGVIKINDDLISGCHVLAWMVDGGGLQ